MENLKKEPGYMFDDETEKHIKAGTYLYSATLMDTGINTPMISCRTLTLKEDANFFEVADNIKWIMDQEDNEACYIELTLFQKLS